MKKKSDTTIVEGSKSGHAAALHFLSRQWLEIVAVIETMPDNTEADISIFDRDAGKRLTIRFPVSDQLETHAQRLAYRFTTRTPDIIYA